LEFVIGKAEYDDIIFMGKNFYFILKKGCRFVPVPKR